MSRGHPVDETLGNPYNDIGSYLLAKGDNYSVCVGSSARLRAALRIYAFPHFNIGRVYEGSSEIS